MFYIITIMSKKINWFFIFFVYSSSCLCWSASEKKSSDVVDLLTIYHYAVKNDMQFALAESTYQANLQNTPIARSDLLPKIALESSTSWNTQNNLLTHSENIAKNSGAPLNFSWNKHAWGASLNQKVIDLESWFTLKSAKAANEQDKFTLEKAKQELIMRTAKAYFNILHLGDMLKTAKTEYRAVKNQLIQAKERYRVGLLPKADVQEAKALYDAVNVKVIEAKNKVSIAYKKLSIIAGIKIDKLAYLNSKFQATSPSPNNPNIWLKHALLNNLDIKASEANKKASKYNLDATYSEFTPKVSASITFGYTSANTFRQLSRNNVTAYSLNFSLPILDGLSTTGKIKQNRYLLEHSIYEIELQKRLVGEETLSTFEEVKTDSSKMGAACQGVVSAKTALNVTTSGYYAGIRKIMDVLQAQKNVYSALETYFNALYSYIINNLRLKYVAGVLKPDDLIDLNRMLDVNLTEKGLNLGYDVMPKCLTNN